MGFVLWCAALAGLMFGPPAHTKHLMTVEQAKCHCVCRWVNADVEDVEALARPGEVVHPGALLFTTGLFVCFTTPVADPKARAREIKEQAWRRGSERAYQAYLDGWGLTVEHCELFDRNGVHVDFVEIEIARSHKYGPPKELKYEKHIYDFNETVARSDRPNGVLHTYLERRR